MDITKLSNILLDRQLSRKYNSKNNDLGGNK